MQRILIVEDDRDLRMGLKFDLEAEGYLVYGAPTLGDALLVLDEKEVDLILLDVNLPDGDGFTFCRNVKKEKQMPVLFLTACDLEEDQLKGFDLGADDYITKPFSMPLLHKRIEVALRRNSGLRNRDRQLYDDGFLRIDFDRMSALQNGRAISFTPTEYKLLKLFIANPGQVLTKQLLLEKIWDSEGNFVDEHAVAVNVNRLRGKLEDAEHKYIKTMYGMGYQWKGARDGQ